MVSALVFTSKAADEPDLKTDLVSVGVQVVGDADGQTWLAEAIKTASDLVVCYQKYPDDALFSSTATLSTSAPRPVVVFTPDPDVDKIERASKSGIHAYVINGYGVHRLRSVLHVAQARFRMEQLLREELNDVNQRFSERKKVDRAKGILMRARQISEDDAYRALRTAAMHTKQRIGQMSQQVIDAATYGEAVNRAGQLRMLSQRLVKLYATQCAGINTEDTKPLLGDVTEHIASNLAILRRTLSKATFGDLIDAAANPWLNLKTALKSAPTITELPKIDALAEELLVAADRLTTNLETVGFATTLRVINVSGRQRMLSQRMAKLAMLTILLDGEARKNAQEQTAQAIVTFSKSLDYLTTIPLSTAAIRAELETATKSWALFIALLQGKVTKAGFDEFDHLSEIMVESFEKLTELYERGMQLLMD